MKGFGWTERFQFLATRGALATLGFARTILVIRLLSTNDYALLAVAESVRMVVTVVAGVGISEAIAREGSIENDRARLRILVGVGLAHTAMFSVAATVAMIAFALIAPFVLAIDARLPAALVLAAGVVLTERFWGYFQSCTQAMHDFRTYSISLFTHGVSIAVLTVALTAEHNVAGYFTAQTAVNGLGALGLGIFTLRRIGLPKLKTIAEHWRSVGQQLWPVAWFAYVSKCSLILWRRLPIIVGAGWIAPPMLGTIAATLDLTSKLHLAHESLAPIILPKLAKQRRDHPDTYVSAARTEIRRSMAMNGAIFLIATLLWIGMGRLIVGPERWNEIGAFFYLALVIELVLLVTNVISVCVLLPTRALSGLSSVTFISRILVAPFLLLLLWNSIDGTLATFAAMVGSGLTLVAAYFSRARRTLRAHTSDAL